MEKRVTLRWTGQGLRFQGEGGKGPPVPFDGKGEEGVSPMDTLLLSVAGCMAIDIRDILEKGRVPLTALEVVVEGERATSPPRRYVKLRLTVNTQGVPIGSEPKLHRAVELSRDRYCSVLHSLRSDLPLEVVIQTS